MDKNAYQEMYNISHQNVVPQTSIDGEMVIGFNEPLLKQKLGLDSTPAATTVGPPTLTPAITLTPVPSPVPPIDDGWGLWGPYNWPKEYQVTNGAYLDLIKNKETTLDGKPVISYYLLSAGLPRDNVYHVWVKSLSNPTPAELSVDVIVDASGYVTAAEGRFQILVQAPAKGEVLELALMTPNKTAGAFGKVIPYPVETRKAPYHIWAELSSLKGDIFAIYGEGFDPGEEISFTSNSDGEILNGKMKADDNGRLSTVILPAVAGKESGLTTCTASGKYGEARISFEWGAAATKAASQNTTFPPASDFQKGMNFTDWRPFDGPVPVRPPLYDPITTKPSLTNLADTGTNWIALMVRGGQETIQSTEIFFQPPATATDEELRGTIDFAHSLGMQVMLKPQINLSQDPTRWHTQIGTAFASEEQWQAWFASYRQFIIHYASLAQDSRADMFCIGQEMFNTVHREADWRRIVREVRQIYKGPIIYEAITFNSSSSEEQRITWWDAVDYIGVSGYFSLTQSNNPTVEDLKAAWVEKGYLSSFESLSQKYQKPIIISEICYLISDGTNTSPLIKAQQDLQEQADCYQAALEVLLGRPWLAGIYWWQWSATGMMWPESPQGRPAEDVLKKYYLAPIPVITPTSTPTPTATPTTTPAGGSGRIILINRVSPPGVAFNFVMSYGAQVGYPYGLLMPDGFQVDSGFILAPGTYTITETLLGGWQLTIDINDPSGGSSSSGSNATINLAAGETVTVTCTNTKAG